MNEIPSALRLLLRLPRPLRIALAFASVAGGVVLAAHASGFLSLVPAGAGLAGYLLLFGSVLDGQSPLPPDSDDEDEPDR